MQSSTFAGSDVLMFVAATMSIAWSLGWECRPAIAPGWRPATKTTNSFPSTPHTDFLEATYVVPSATMTRARGHDWLRETEASFSLIDCAIDCSGRRPPRGRGDCASRASRKVFRSNSEVTGSRVLRYDGRRRLRRFPKPERYVALW